MSAAGMPLLRQVFRLKLTLWNCPGGRRDCHGGRGRRTGGAAL